MKALDTIINNIKIKKRLSIAFIAIIAIFFITILSSIASLFTVAQSLSTFYNDSYQVVKTTSDMRYAFNNVQKDILSAASTENMDKTQEYLKELEESIETVTVGMDILKEKFAGDHKLLEEFNELFNIAEQYEKEIVGLANINTVESNKEAVELYFSKYESAITEAQEKLTEIQAVSNENARRFYEQGNKSKSQAISLVSALSIIAIVFTIRVCIRLSNSLTRPIYDLERAAKELSEGNLNTEITYEGQDELGHLADSLRQTIGTLSGYVKNIDETLNEIENKNMLVTIDIDYIGDFMPIKKSILSIASAMQETLGGIRDVASQVSNGAQQIAQAGETVAEGAVEQSSVVQEVLAMINEVSEKVTDNAKQATELAVISEGSLQGVENGNDFMNKLLESMKEMINQTQEISSIIQLVESISAQTNLLSLNASIEAARAGEHGAGFAVVANEIGKLANESTKATKDIAGLIEKTVRAIEEGAKLATETSTVLLKVVDSTKETNKVVQDITSACNEQADALKEVAGAVGQITQVVEANASVAEETSASSEELLAQAEVVTGLLSEFKLEN